MKILVTGTAGFIGFHLSDKLLKLGYKVIGIDNINDYYSVTLKEERLSILKNKNFVFYKTDLENKSDIERIFQIEKPDVVVNLAAQAGVRYSLKNPHSYIESNIIGFLNILESCRNNNIKHLLYASSSSVYGGNTISPNSVSDSVNHPLNIYAASKKANELMAHSYSSLYNLPTTGLRFFTVYGPWGRPDMAIHIFVENIISGKPIDIYNNGEMIRNFTYVSDVVEAVSRLISKPPKPNLLWKGENVDPSSSFAPYKIYNIASDKSIKLIDLVNIIEKKLEKKAIKKFLPLQRGDVPNTLANLEDLYVNINFRPQTSINYGIEKFIDWYVDYYGVKKL